MADQFLAEQHTWTLAQNAVSDEEDSWVMLTRDGEIVPIPGEKILYTSRPRVGLELSVPKELQISESFSVKSDNGIAYITNERVSPPLLVTLPCRPKTDRPSLLNQPLIR